MVAAPGEDEHSLKDRLGPAVAVANDMEHMLVVFGDANVDAAVRLALVQPAGEARKAHREILADLLTFLDCLDAAPKLPLRDLRPRLSEFAYAAEAAGAQLAVAADEMREAVR